jgi:hypothetical protein
MRLANASTDATTTQLTNNLIEAVTKNPGAEEPTPNTHFRHHREVHGR